MIVTPKELKEKFPLNKNEYLGILKSRNIISNIINGQDSRLLIVCGPCSIHDTNSAIEYAHKLKLLSIKLSKRLYIVMRVYLEKPRTNIGWKGLINDPYMDGSLNIEKGLDIARSLLLKIIKIGLPIATEILNPNNLHYFDDLLSWSSIGARTVESQVHREIASGLLMPVGFKNSINGDILSAINAMHAASISHSFIDINQIGKIYIKKTYGNKNSHIILRGGKKPNYYINDINFCKKEMFIRGLRPSIMIDCSHGNSNYNYQKQKVVVYYLIKQIKSGNCSILGIMLESNIYESNQLFKIPNKKLIYGVSITDGCINWESTSNLLNLVYDELFNINK